MGILLILIGSFASSQGSPASSGGSLPDVATAAAHSDSSRSVESPESGSSGSLPDTVIHSTQSLQLQSSIFNHTAAPQSPTLPRGLMLDIVASQTMHFTHSSSVESPESNSPSSLPDRILYSARDSAPLNSASGNSAVLEASILSRGSLSNRHATPSVHHHDSDPIDSSDTDSSGSLPDAVLCRASSPQSLRFNASTRIMRLESPISLESDSSGSLPDNVMRSDPVSLALHSNLSAASEPPLSSPESSSRLFHASTADPHTPPAISTALSPQNPPAPFADNVTENSRLQLNVQNRGSRMSVDASEQDSSNDLAEIDSSSEGSLAFLAPDNFVPAMYSRRSSKHFGEGRDRVQTTLPIQPEGVSAWQDVVNGAFFYSTILVTMY